MGPEDHVRFLWEYHKAHIGVIPETDIGRQRIVDWIRDDCGARHMDYEKVEKEILKVVYGKEFE